MKSIFLLLVLLLNIPGISHAQESRLQMMMGKYFADISLDSSETVWNNTLASSHKFKFDTSRKFYHNVYKVLESDHLKEYVPELHQAFITSYLHEFKMMGGKFIDTYEVLKIQYHLVDSFSKQTAKQVYKRLKKSTNSLFRYTKEHIEFPGCLIVLRCSNRPFATFADLEITIQTNKQTGTYSLGLTYARRKE
jgi:hypothetical protein